MEENQGCQMIWTDFHIRWYSWCCEQGSASQLWAKLNLPYRKPNSYQVKQNLGITEPSRIVISCVRRHYYSSSVFYSGYGDINKWNIKKLSSTSLRVSHRKQRLDIFLLLLLIINTNVGQKSLLYNFDIVGSQTMDRSLILAKKYISYFQPPAMLVTPCIYMQFPIATIWPTRDFCLFFLLTDDHKKCIFSFSRIYLGRSRRKRQHICSRAHWASLWREPVRGGGWDRLLHMSVAMGILAQWLCRLRNGGFVFRRDALQRKEKKKEHTLAGASAVNYGGRLF